MDSQNTLISMQMRSHQLKKKLSEAWKRKIEEQREREADSHDWTVVLFIFNYLVKALVEATSQRGSRCAIFTSIFRHLSFSVFLQRCQSIQRWSQLSITRPVTIKLSVRRWSQLSRDWTYTVKRFESSPIMKLKLIKTLGFATVWPCRCSEGFKNINLSNVNTSTDCLLAMYVFGSETQILMKR